LALQLVADLEARLTELSNTATHSMDEVEKEETHDSK